MTELVDRAQAFSTAQKIFVMLRIGMSICFAAARLWLSAN
jgi:hypothetical protein